jgi:hypothetical protein
VAYHWLGLLVDNLVSMVLLCAFVLVVTWQAVRKSGPRSLYYGIIPYCFESWPYDTSEVSEALMTLGGAVTYT